MSNDANPTKSAWGRWRERRKERRRQWEEDARRANSCEIHGLMLQVVEQSYHDIWSYKEIRRCVKGCEYVSFREGSL